MPPVVSGNFVQKVQILATDRIRGIDPRPTLKRLSPQMPCWLIGCFDYSAAYFCMNVLTRTARQFRANFFQTKHTSDQIRGSDMQLRMMSDVARLYLKGTNIVKENLGFLLNCTNWDFFSATGL